MKPKHSPISDKKTVNGASSEKSTPQDWIELAKSIPSLKEAFAVVGEEIRKENEKRYSRLIKAIDEAAAEGHDFHTSHIGCPFCERGGLGKELQKLVPSVQNSVPGEDQTKAGATSEAKEGVPKK